MFFIRKRSRNGFCLLKNPFRNKVVMCSCLLISHTGQLSLYSSKNWLFAVWNGWAFPWFDIDPLLSVTTGVSSPRPWSSVATVQLVQSNSHTLLIALASARPVTPTAPATWKAHLLATILCRCHPPFNSEGREGRWKGKGGEKREAHPERMLDKDGSRDILSTFISSGGGELCWILACYWQSHTSRSTDGEHVTIKSTPPHFHPPHWKSGTYGAGCQLLILYGH